MAVQEWYIYLLGGPYERYPDEASAREALKAKPAGWLCEQLWDFDFGERVVVHKSFAKRVGQNGAIVGVMDKSNQYVIQWDDGTKTNYPRERVSPAPREVERIEFRSHISCLRDKEEWTENAEWAGVPDTISVKCRHQTPCDLDLAPLYEAIAAGRVNATLHGSAKCYPPTPSTRPSPLTVTTIATIHYAD